jgi:glycerol-3-phosphate dehydrogenase
MGENHVYDVVVIGAGITGAGIAYELSKLDVDAAIVDKATMPTQGTSKGNSGIIHAGYDDPKGSLREQLVVRGNRRWDDWQEELGVDVVRTGSLVVAFNQEDLEYVRSLYSKGQERNVRGLELLDGDEVRDLEPNLAPGVKGALRATTAAVVCPMRMVNFLFKNAVVNGVEPLLGREVIGLDFSHEAYAQVHTSRGTARARAVVNAAGVHGDEVSAMAGVTQYSITPRRGEYILLEPHPDYNVDHVIFPVPTKHSKGALVIPTSTGDILIGPTAHDLPKEQQDDTSTTPEGLAEVLEKTSKLVPSLSTTLTVKTYAGNRAQSNTDDFIVEGYDEPRRLVNAIGIRSPGLTAAPAIADRVLELTQAVIGPRTKRRDFTGVRFQVHEPAEEALSDIRWADTLTPHLDSPPTVLLEEAWGFGVQTQIYNYSCFCDRGLGADLGSSFQNELIRYITSKGMDLQNVVYREASTQQVVPK